MIKKKAPNHCRAGLFILIPKNHLERSIGFGVGGRTASVGAVLGIVLPLFGGCVGITRCLSIFLVTNPSMIIPSLHMTGFDLFGGFAIFKFLLYR